MKKNKFVISVGIKAGVLILIFTFGLILSGCRTVSNSETNVAKSETNVAKSAANTNTKTSPTPANNDNPFLQILSTSESETNEPWYIKAGQIIVRLFLAVILSGILAFRPRKNIPLFQRNLYVAQTQILLAVVAAALMMIVGDNTARAFAIFAAVSLVRFRTNIRDPKEITVLLISLALGLASGVGRWELGLTLCIFVLILLWVLEFKESEQVFRSMELTIKTRNTDATQAILKKIFSSNNLEAEVREVNPSDEKDPIGTIVYYLNLRINISTDKLSDRIFALDGNNIDGIQWKQQKSVSNGYQ